MYSFLSYLHNLIINKWNRTSLTLKLFLTLQTSIKDKSNFDSVKIQGDFYFYDKYKKKYKYDVGNLMMASHDFSNGNLTSSVKRLEYIINEQPEYHTAQHFYIQVLIKLKFRI